METTTDIVPNWVPILHSVLWAYRSTPHSVTKASPAKLIFGVEIKLPFDSVKEPEPPTDEKHKELIATRLRFIKDTLPGLRENKYKTRHHDFVPPKEFHVNDKVWLRNTKYDAHGIVPVFAERWQGPYIVAGVLERNTYRLRTIPKVTGKRAILLASPINGIRLKLYEEGLVPSLTSAE
jgi:hypothetical protein